MDPAAPTWISCRAYAKHRGVTPMAVSTAISSGRIGPPAVVRDENGQPKIAAVALADQQWARNTDPVRAANALVQGTTAGPPVPVLVIPRPAAPPLPTPPTIDRAPAEEPESAATATERLKAAQADLAELKLERERGELVLAKDVERRLVAVFTACKTRLLAIPSRARQALPELTNAGVLVIEDLVREALEELAEAEPVP